MTQRLVLLPWEEYQVLKEGQSGGARKEIKDSVENSTQQNLNIKDPIKNPIEDIIPTIKDLPKETIENITPRIPGPPGVLATDWLIWK